MSVVSRRGLLLGFAGAAATPAQQTPTVHRDTIDAAAVHQTIENFGASDCWRVQRLIDWSETSRRRVAELLFCVERGIGLSCWRFNIGAGIDRAIRQPWRTTETFETAPGVYDWTRQAGQRWFLRAAKEHGVPQFLAFSLSGTARMTRNGHTFAAKGNTTNLKPGMEPDYARYLADILEHFKTNPDPKERIPFDYISPVNEPQWDWVRPSQEGTPASNEDLRRLLRALHAELQRRRLASAIIAPESGSLPDMWSSNAEMMKTLGAIYGNYLEEFAGDRSMAEALSKRICYHSYWSDLLDGELVERRRELGRRFGKYAGWKLWQTEYCVMKGPEGAGGNGRDLTMKTALDVARVIHLDLTLANVSAWHWWTAVSEADYKDGLVYTDWRKPGDPESITPSRLLWALGNYSRFIRPGAVRVSLDGPKHDVRGLMGSAFRDPRAGRITAVYVNVGADEQTVELTFWNAGRVGRVTPYVTSERAGDDLKPCPAQAPGKPFRIPGRSVVTLVAEMERA